MKKYNLIIIGAGPAGLTASIYISRFGIRHLIIGSLIEGRMAEANEVGNFPTEGEIGGKELIKKMEKHVKDFGTEILLDKVIKVIKNKDNFLVKTITGKEYYTEILLLAIGAERKKLDIPGEKEFLGRGVSYCATCDGRLFADKIVAVVGGSSAAATTADYLADLAKKVYLVHSENILKADKIWQEKLKKNPKIEIILDNKIRELKGENLLKVAILEKNHQEKKDLKLDGVFVEMGIVPNLEIINGVGVKKSKNGFIMIKKDGSTTIRGVWAAGDITDGSNNFRQIITACAEGTIAAQSIFSYLKQSQ